MIPVSQVIYSDHAAAAKAKLAKAGTKVAASIGRKIDWYHDRIPNDAHACELILMPLPVTARQLEQRHGPTDKLRCCDLPDGWRLLYTFYRVEGRTYAYVLEIVAHEQYSKWFPGRRDFGKSRA